MASHSSKESIRRMIWDYLEENDLAEFPRPVHHRIPNFKGAAEACNRLGRMEIFQKAKTIKVNPDKPQQQARFLALEAHKTLLVPTPRLRTGLFNRITPPAGANKKMLRTCSSSQGVRQYSAPVGLDAEVKVDLVIIGSVAVSPKGYRIGKGEGYADMEFAMMSSMGAVNKDTVVITTVHDCQVQDDLPDHLFGDHDLGVDLIMTPTRTIECENKRARPKGIVWELLTREKFSQIPVLKVLRRQEAEMGIDVRLKEERSEGGVECHTAKERIDRRVEESGRFVDSSTAATAKNYSNDEASLLRMHGKMPGVESSFKEKRYTSDRMDARVSQGLGDKKSGDNDKNGTDERSKGYEMKGQSANNSKRSKGHKPNSGRRKDLAGMFAWN
ncbi:methenyltetrahydrofolate synthase domain-containing protein-like [Lytechinus pictus]|uniref:methenyltetrahydrofolate synthase domain-containing protein-like n=1 Tax=Lytechinus pictus TaxID=7653 RepID=UPI0030B9F278